MDLDPEHADAETQARRVALADAVREDLAAAGLPVVPGGDGFDTDLSHGAKVYVDQFTDEDGGGVFVGWSSHYVVEAAAGEAVMLGAAEDDPAIMFSGKVAEAMQDAIAAILVAAGYSVETDVNDYAPYDLLVLGRERQESWRSWLSQQLDRLQEQRTQKTDQAGAEGSAVQ